MQSESPEESKGLLADVPKHVKKQQKKGLQEVDNRFIWNDTPSFCLEFHS